MGEREDEKTEMSEGARSPQCTGNCKGDGLNHGIWHGHGGRAEPRKAMIASHTPPVLLPPEPTLPFCQCADNFVSYSNPSSYSTSVHPCARLPKSRSLQSMSIGSRGCWWFRTIETVLPFTVFHQGDSWPLPELSHQDQGQLGDLLLKCAFIQHFNHNTSKQNI